MTGTQRMGTTTAAPETQPVDAPVAFGKYRVVARLGAGGFGSVWRCQDEALGREVAVKALAQHAAVDPELRERFLLEARALARVNHPGVVQVFDVGESEAGPFFVMELVAGRDLEHILKDGGPLPEARALALCRQAVLGLQAAANAGVVHRDIKPANLMVSGAPGREHVKVTDFGLAFPTAAVSGPRITAPTTILGTPEYMAPEQARGEAVDHRADMYSLGATLYELLTGAPPFTGDTPQAVLAAHLTQPPSPPRARKPDLTIPTNNLVLRLLAKDAASRFSTHDELLAALDGALAGAPGASPASGVSGSTLLAVPPPPAPGGTTRLDGAAVQTQNLAMVFVDLMDFQERTSQQTRDENTAWVGQFSDGMKRLIRQRGGRFIKQVYGTVLCTFVSPTDAVLFGMAAVDAAWEWSRDKAPLMNYQLRVGINLGEVRLEKGDVFGDPVNVAARVMAKAHAQEVWFSDAVYLAMNRSEADAQAQGAHELKGVPVPVRLFSAKPVKGYVAGENAAPFGVRGGPVSSNSGDALVALEKLDKGARAVVDGMGRAAGSAARVGPLVQRAVGQLVAITRALLGRVPEKYRSLVGVGVPALLVVVVGGSLYVRYANPYRKELDLLADGKGGAAARLLEQRTAEHPYAQWLYGKALMMSGKKVEGLEQWDLALKRDPSLANDETLEGVLGALDTKDRVGRVILVRHFGKRAANAIAQRTSSERYWVRHHAAQALRDMDLDAQADWAGVYLKDVRLETDCGKRRDAVRALEELGDIRALSALGAIQADPGGEPGCVADLAQAAERRLKKKTGQQQ